MKSPDGDTYIVLCDIRSIHNVASIFRTADCLGVTSVILAGYTPTPLDRFGRARKDFSKVALGAEKTVSWRKFSKISQALSFLKRNKIHTIAVEQAHGSLDYKKVKPYYPAAFLFGNEVDGISLAHLAKCDMVAEIPMLGGKESLNVSVAVGIAVARMLNR